MKAPKKPRVRPRRRAHKSQKRRNKLIKSEAFKDWASTVVGDQILLHACRGMSFGEKGVLATIIETVIRPILGKISEKSIEAALERIEADRIEGEYEECR